MVDVVRITEGLCVCCAIDPNSLLHGNNTDGCEFLVTSLRVVECCRHIRKREAVVENDILPDW